MTSNIFSDILVIYHRRYTNGCLQLYKKEIITGNLLPGSIFNEADIISKLKVSRTPVREAVLKLASEGYLTIIPRKGTIISNISFNDVSQVYEYRLMLEPEICSKAAPIMDKSLCLKWKEYFNNLLLNKNQSTR